MAGAIKAWRRRAPISRDPATLTTNVPYGNDPPPNRCTPVATR